MPVCHLRQEVKGDKSAANVEFTNLSNYFFMAESQSIALMFQRSLHCYRVYLVTNMKVRAHLVVSY